ncbi:hypothetical protein TWF718_008191 [Orbilia javanica]|uniref:Uncharacterized protein n=1 Tax=Orbilia javanica TaxID=47235 RepID=A0AAN8MWF9_9PEZI
MQLPSLTLLVTALLINLSLGSPIQGRVLEASKISGVTSRRLDTRDENPPLEKDCSKYKFKPEGDKKQSKHWDRMCPKFCEAVKKNPNSPASKRFEQAVRLNCAVPPPAA